MRAQRFFEILDVRILEGGDLDDAGVVDENVEAPAALNDCRDGAGNVVRIADIAMQAVHVEGLGAEARHCALDLLVTPREDEDSSAAAGKLSCEQIAKPTGAAADCDGLAIHVVTGQPRPDVTRANDRADRN